MLASGSSLIVEFLGFLVVFYIKGNNHPDDSWVFAYHPGECNITEIWKSREKQYWKGQGFILPIYSHTSCLRPLTHRRGNAGK